MNGNQCFRTRRLSSVNGSSDRIIRRLLGNFDLFRADAKHAVKFTARNGFIGPVFPWVIEITEAAFDIHHISFDTGFTVDEVNSRISDKVRVPQVIRIQIKVHRLIDLGKFAVFEQRDLG